MISRRKPKDSPFNKASMTLNKYMVHAEFTTYQSGGRFTARSADVCLQSDCSLEEIKKEAELVKQLCVNFILSKRPTFKIFMLDVKTISNYDRE